MREHVCMRNVHVLWLRTTVSRLGTTTRGSKQCTQRFSCDSSVPKPTTINAESSEDCCTPKPNCTIKRKPLVLNSTLGPKPQNFESLHHQTLNPSSLEPHTQALAAVFAAGLAAAALVAGASGSVKGCGYSAWGWSEIRSHRQSPACTSQCDMANEPKRKDTQEGRTQRRKVEMQCAVSAKLVVWQCLTKCASTETTGFLECRSEAHRGLGRTAKTPDHAKVKNDVMSKLSHVRIYFIGSTSRGRNAYCSTSWTNKKFMPHSILYEATSLQAQNPFK